MFLFVRWVSILLEVFEIAVDMCSIFETTQSVKKDPGLCTLWLFNIAMENGPNRNR